MILQPERGMRNVNDAFYDYEAEQIALLNELFGDITLSREEERTLVWLTQGTPYGCAGWEKSTVMNVVSAIRKAIAAEANRREQPSCPETPKSWCRRDNPATAGRSPSGEERKGSF